MLTREKLKALVQKISQTREEEIGCEDCFAELDKFVEHLLEGENVENAMPLVHHHLELCGDCHEEFEALLTALETIG